MISMRFRNGLPIKDLVAELSTRFREIISPFIPSQSVTFAELETSGTLQQAQLAECPLRSESDRIVASPRNDASGQ